MEAIKNGFRGLEFTAANSSEFPLEPVPSATEPLDLETESKNLRVWENGKGLEYHLSYGYLARIMSWEDDDNPLEGGSGTIRLAVAEAIDGNWPIYREPTLEEMVSFVRVAKHEMPDTPQANILEDQVIARIIKQARGVKERASALHELARSLT